MKEIKWYRSIRDIDPKMGPKEDQEAIDIVKKDNCIVRLLFDRIESIKVGEQNGHSIIQTKTVNKYREFENIGNNIEIEIREGIL